MNHEPEQLMEFNSGTAIDMRSWVARGMNHHERDELLKAATNETLIECPCAVCVDRRRLEELESRAWSVWMEAEERRATRPIRIGDWISKVALVGLSLGFIAICYHAFVSGAMERLAR